MTVWTSRAAVTAAAVVACVVVVGATGPAAATPVRVGELDHRVLFRFSDRAITESSGLVDASAVVYTVNDSGDGPLLYAVDPRTGETTGVTEYAAAEVEDVEAMAPAVGGGVWVGDIGDNLARRPSVSVFRVRPGAADAPRFDLTYPDGPRDAEAMLAHPVTGRLFVVSKAVFGGVVYAAGALVPGEPNRLRRFAQVPGLVTDGAFLPDGRHVLLRGYGTLTLYTFPGFEPRGTVALPAQRQGEGIAVGRDGRILLSSEGSHAPVLEVSLPSRVAAETEPSVQPSVQPSVRPSGEPSGGPVGDPESGPGAGPGVGWLLGGAALLAVLAGLTWTTRRRP